MKIEIDVNKASLSLGGLSPFPQRMKMDKFDDNMYYLVETLNLFLPNEQTITFRFNPSSYKRINLVAVKMIKNTFDVNTLSCSAVNITGDECRVLFDIYRKSKSATKKTQASLTGSIEFEYYGVTQSAALNKLIADSSMHSSEDIKRQLAEHQAQIDKLMQTKAALDSVFNKIPND